MAGRASARPLRKLPFSFRLPEDTYDRLAAAADEFRLPMTWFVVRAIDDLLDRLIDPADFRITKRSEP